MPDPPPVQRIIEAAEQAAASGDLESAQALLGQAARLQEAELGPGHLELASTFNNLGVVCERANKLADAEQFYRRAYAVASASLDSHHPFVTTSRNNLWEFCHAHGSPWERPAANTDADSEIAVARTEGKTPAPAGIEPADAAAPRSTVPRPSIATRYWRGLVGGGLASVALLVAMLVTRAVQTPPDPTISADVLPPTPPHSASVPPPVSTSEAAQPRPPAEPGKVAGRPTGEAARSPAVEPPPKRPTPPSSDARERDSAATADAAGVRVFEAAVCRSLSTSSTPWQCAAAPNPAPPGVLYFYTRIAAARNVRVHHRWYRGDRLRQDVELSVGANPGAGYRTYSRQTVDAEGGDQWRVELVTASGELLREERIVVR